MVNEHLRIEFGAERSNVVVTFRFQNPDTTRSVTQLAGFPDISLGEPEEHELENLVDTMGPLIGLRTYIDGREVPSKLRRGRVVPDSAGIWSPVPIDSVVDGLNQIIAWHVVELHLPPGGTVTLQRRYSTTNGGDGLAGGLLDYIVHTAAGWQGRVGKLTADLFILKDLRPDKSTGRPGSTSVGRTSASRGSRSGTESTRGTIGSCGLTSSRRPIRLARSCGWCGDLTAGAMAIGHQIQMRQQNRTNSKVHQTMRYLALDDSISIDDYTGVAAGGANSQLADRLGIGPADLVALFHRRGVAPAEPWYVLDIEPTMQGATAIADSWFRLLQAKS